MPNNVCWTVVSECSSREQDAVVEEWIKVPTFTFEVPIALPCPRICPFIADVILIVIRFSRKPLFTKKASILGRGR